MIPVDISVKGLLSNQGRGTMEDKEIIDLYLAREEAAISATAEKYGNYCYTVAYNILYNKEDAEESVNDTYLGAWNSIPPHKPEVLSSFLGKITRYVSLKRHRDKHAQKRGGGELSLAYEELADCIPASHDIVADLEAKEIARYINDFLSVLPATERHIFICRYWYFDSIASISRQFGFRETKVKSMLFRTRTKLRNKLLKEGVMIED